MKWQEPFIAMPFKSKLTSIGVGGFKSIKDLQPPSLNPINVFIGANGAGKLNLVSLFLLLKAIANGKLQEFVGRAGGADSLLYYGAKATSMIWIALKFEFKTGPADYFLMLASTATDSLVFSQERINYSSVKGSHPLSRQLGSGHRESLLLTDGNDYREIADCLSSIGVFIFTIRPRLLQSGDAAISQTTHSCDQMAGISQHSSMPSITSLQRTL